MGVDAKANDDRLDSKLREELNSVTSLLGDEFRAQNVKTQEAFTNLKGIVLGAVEAARNLSAGPTIPSGIPNSAALKAALAQLDGRASALSATVHSPTTDFTIVRVQIGDLISAVGALQTATRVQHSGFAASAGDADAASGAAIGPERNMGGTG